MSNNIQAVDRVLQMLMAYSSARREIGVGEFAELLGVHKSTASRLAGTLARRGFLKRQPDSQLFHLGPELGRLGLLALGTQDLIALARDAMERLAVETGETVNLAVLDGNEAVNIAQAEGPHLVGVGSWIGRRTKLHCASNGKVFLAFANAPMPEGTLEAVTPTTITSVQQLREQVEQVRRQGWASNIGETEEGLNSIAVPVFDTAGRCLAAISVAGPAYRMTPERLAGVAAQSLRSAQDLTNRLQAQ